MVVRSEGGVLCSIPAQGQISVRACACAPMAAADKKRKAKVQGAMYVKTARIKLADLSLQSDSGWREVSESRVAELEAVILAGDFGNTILRRPTVLYDQGDQVHTAGAGKRNPLG